MISAFLLAQKLVFVLENGLLVSKVLCGLARRIAITHSNRVLLRVLHFETEVGVLERAICLAHFVT